MGDDVATDAELRAIDERVVIVRFNFFSEGRSFSECRRRRRNLLDSATEGEGCEGPSGGSGGKSGIDRG